MSFLAEQSGYTRQWLSRMAALGDIPGATRTASGRWKFVNSPTFETWLSEQREQNRARMRYTIYRDVYAVEALRDKREKAWRCLDGTIENFKRKMKKLRDEITIAEANVSDCLTANEIARLTGRSKRWVTTHAHLIPGVAVSKNRLLFRKSDMLAEWVWREKQAKRAENRKPSRSRILYFHPPTRLLSDLRQLRRLSDDLLRGYPLHVWPAKFQEEFKIAANELTKIFQSHMKPIMHDSATSP